MSISKRLRFEVFKRDSFTCQYCGAKPPDTVLEVDHVHPRSKGGRDTMDNLKTACWNCNRGKSASPIPRLVTLGTSPDNEPGPRCGESIKTTAQYPCYWVFESNGNFELYEDEIDADVYHTQYETRLKWGHPGLQLGMPGREWVYGQWESKWKVNERFSEAWNAKRTLIGFYVSVISDPPGPNPLGWFPGATAFEYFLTPQTQTLPDYEGEE